MSAAELIVTDDVPRHAIRACLRGWFTTVDGDPEVVERVYYDTFDGLLRKAGLTLSIEPGTLTLSRRDGQSEPLTEEFPDAPPTPLHVDVLMRGPLRRLLEPVVGVRALLEIARVHVSVEPVAVLDQLQKTVVRLLLECPVGLRDRIHVVQMRGYGRERDQVVELLEDCSALEVTSVPLVDEAVIAGGGDPAGIGSGLDVPLEPDEPADEAVAKILTRLTEVREANLPGLLEDVDLEFLHDFRVALRRSRAVVREFRGVFPVDRHDWIRAELRWLQTVTGETRDLDVYLQDFEQLRELTLESMRGDLDPLLEVLRDRHRLARMTMVRALHSERAEALRGGWADLLADLPELPPEGRPDAKVAVDSIASRGIRRLHRRMIRMGEAIDDSSPPQDYHELRKQGKELRYMLELFGRPLHDPEVVQSLIRALKALQDVLGRHQDREVQIEMLRSLADAVVARPGGPGAVLAMGAMIDRLEDEAASARAEFHARFVDFSSKRQRRMVKETFSR